MSNAVKLTEVAALVLPPSLIGRTDILRVLREVEALDQDLSGQAIRNPGQPLTIPTLSQAVAQAVELNKINLSDPDSRQVLVTSLRGAKDAPSVQLTFASEPEPEIVQDLAAWIRTNLHPQALLAIGLQPALVGGVVVRTPDHIYDFSLRGRFKAALPTLVKDMAAARHEQ